MRVESWVNMGCNIQGSRFTNGILTQRAQRSGNAENAERDRERGQELFLTTDYGDYTDGVLNRR